MLNLINFQYREWVRATLQKFTITSLEAMAIRQIKIKYYKSARSTVEICINLVTFNN